MEKQIDDLGRIVIPKDMRKKLKLDNGSTVNIELVEGSIVLTNPNEIDYKDNWNKLKEWLEIIKKACPDDLFQDAVEDIKNKMLELEEGK